MHENTENQIREQIEKLENQRLQAMVENDVSALDQLLGEDLIYIHSTGGVEDKHVYLESLRSGKRRYEKFECSDVRIRVYGETTASVTGRIRVRLRTRGQDRELNNAFTNLWVRDNRGEWRFVSWQATPIPG